MNYACYKPFAERTAGEAGSCIVDEIKKFIDYVVSAWVHVFSDPSVATMSDWSMVGFCVFILIFMFK